VCTGLTGVIITLADDDGVPAALVDTSDGRPLLVSLLTCPDARAGQTVLIHSGYVLAVLCDRPAAAAR
jgi:hydrogenase maturation factor